MTQGIEGGDLGEREFSEALISLFKGPIYRDSHERVWQAVLRHRRRISAHVAPLGLEEYVDEPEGYAFLRAAQDEDEPDPLPRLVPRHRLSFPLSLLLVLLRKRLIEHDAAGGSTLLVISREQIVEMLLVFLPANANEARLIDQIETHIKKAVDLGFLRAVRGGESMFEVRRILAAFVDAQWLSDFDARLAAYAEQVGETS